ncbi:MAG: hypothetical protein F4069_09905 [Rhodothermaceae bacterium]|nr:hypothetical protein [Rhodothermaceae bacterium]MYG68850.1 hypothetical protein [Rhodothermaceae bacterium]MYJ45620.1 hypothetical protein [Rhodothermaceae bacterium]
MHSSHETILPDRTDQARLWVIPLEGTQPDLQNLLAQVQLFLEEWTSHGRAIESSATLDSNRFLLIAGEIAGGTISGCGIDALMNAVEEISEHHHCRILSSMFIYYRSEHGGVDFSSRSQFRKLIAQNLIFPETSIFNPGIHTLNALRGGEFELPLCDSVYARIFRIPATA